MMSVHPSGYYAWRAAPLSARAKSDQRLSGLIKQSWLESGGVYGYHKITKDLMAVVFESPQPGGQHESARLLLGQRSGRKLLPATQAEADSPENLR